MFQNLSLNRVEIEETSDMSPAGGARPKKKKKSYDLNPTDKFWQSQKARSVTFTLLNLTYGIVIDNCGSVSPYESIFFIFM